MRPLKLEDGSGDSSLPLIVSEAGVGGIGLEKTGGGKALGGINGGE